MSDGAPSPPDAHAVFYDDVWERFARLDAESPAARHRRRLVIARVANALARRPPGAGRPRLLDAGMGPGHLLTALAAALPTLELAGTDLSPRSLELARRAGVPGLSFSLDLERPDFAARAAAHLERYDFVVCSEVLEHLGDDTAAVRHVRALLAPGGTLVVTVPGGGRSRFDLRIGHQRHYTRRTLGTLLAAHGLRPESVTAWGFPFHSAYRAAVRAASRLEFGSDRPLATTDGAPEATEIRPLLRTAYGLVGAVLDPLFYLNLSWGGEQLLAVARRED